MARRAIYLGSNEQYDAIILDLGLPEIDGLTVLDRWRKEGKTTPVLVLTARDSWSDKVAGLDAGADDYVAKPFQTEELIARLRALIRRASGNASAELIAGDIRLDTRSGKVTKAGEPVKLTAQEYKLLSYLLHHKGKVVSRTELIEHIYDQDFDRDSNTIEVFVTRIRKKLGADVITTIRGLQPRLHASRACALRRTKRIRSSGRAIIPAPPDRSAGACCWSPPPGSCCCWSAAAWRSIECW
jgi:two-component system OmpR family response regulator